MRSWFALVATLCLLPTTVQAQTSVGFSDAEDNSNLLDYRLPDWSYRVWDASIDLHGQGSESQNMEHLPVGNTINFSLATTYTHSWEGENRDLYLLAEGDGAWERSHREQEDREERRRRGSGRLNLEATWKQYMGNGPFSVLMEGDTYYRYSESNLQTRHGDDPHESGDILRSTDNQLAAGVGYGRIRNVGPLLRAQRLSDRLQALDRSGLNPQQIQELARVLATQYGYRQVFDRSDKALWSDLLGPVLDASNPLTPYEVMYLTEVLNENLGHRYQGFTVQLSYAWSEQYRKSDGGNRYTSRRVPRLTIGWSHNPSLTQQLRGRCSVEHSWVQYRGEDEDDGALDIYLEHLWNLADRYSWTNRLLYLSDVSISGYSGGHRCRWDSAIEVFLEDQLSLHAGVEAQYAWAPEDNDDASLWDWRYRLSCAYHIDRVMFN